MQLGLESDLNNPNFVGARNPDEMLWVRFESRKFEVKFKSEKEGHPVYEMRDFVIIQAPGDKNEVRISLVTEEHKKRWPQKWAHYVNTKENLTPQGWLIESWPVVNAAQVEELKYRKCFTVEQLAEMPFSLIQTMGMGYIELQTKAKHAVLAAKDSAVVQSQAAELKKRDDEIALLKAQNDSIIARMEQIAAKQEEKPKRGRPPLNRDSQPDLPEAA